MTANGLKHTPLHEAHRALNARLVDFGGWEMPLHYGSQLDEHHRVRRGAGIFDVSHMLAIDITGVGATTFLRLLLANDVARLRNPGQALYSCLLNETGGILDDLIVYRLNADSYRMVVNAGTADKDLAWIEAQRDARAVGVDLARRRDLAMIAVQGPAARECLWHAVPDARDATQEMAAFHGTSVKSNARGEMFVGRTGYTGEDGFEVMIGTTQAVALWNSLLEHGAAPCGLGARDTLRLEAGMNLYGQDMDETVTPAECGLAWTVAMAADRDFIGKEALQANPKGARQAGLVLRSKGILRSHQAVRTSRGNGMVTSGSFSPTLNASIAFARVPADVAVGENVEVQIRDKWLPAQVVKYPFVRNGKALVDVPPV